MSLVKRCVPTTGQNLPMFTTLNMVTFRKVNEKVQSLFVYLKARRSLSIMILTFKRCVACAFH